MNIICRFVDEYVRGLMNTNISNLHISEINKQQNIHAHKSCNQLCSELIIALHWLVVCWFINRTKAVGFALTHSRTLETNFEPSAFFDNNSLVLIIAFN